MRPAETRAEVERLLSTDPDVPGLALLLDDDALGEWVGRRLGPDVVGARRTYLRWKPGAGGVARVRLERVQGTDRPDGTGASDVFLAVWRPGSAPKLDKTVERGGRAVLAVDRDALAVLARPTADRHLPALGRLLAPGVGTAVARLHGDEADRRLLHRAAAAPATVRTLAWKPQRRWVGTVGSPATAQVVLRAGRPRAAEGVVDRYRAVARVLGEQAPRVLGANLHRGLVAVQHLPGETLQRPGRSAVDDSPADVTLRATGELVARLHAGRSTAGEVVPALSVQQECDAVEAAADTLALLAPVAAARPLAVELLRRLRGLPPEPERLLHGDLSPDQVVVGADGDVALIDLDEAVRGPAGYDLAGLAAAWALHRPAAVAGLLEQVHAGYGRHLDLPDAEGLQVRTAAHLLRRAPEPFRTGSPTWPADVRRAVALAAEVLDDGGSVLSTRTRTSTSTGALR